MDSFLILGHGIENTIQFEERNRIPEGVTLVTFAECGVITTTKEVCPMTEAFTKEENREIFRNPKANKDTIRMFLNGKDVHIYESGDRYPTLMIQMFLDWSHDDYVKIFKSGLYTFPISEKDFRLGLCNDFCEALFKKIGPYEGFRKKIPKDFRAADMFKGSLYPTTAEVEAKQSEVIGAPGSFTSQSDLLKKAFTVPLETLFEKGGPGVYYFVVCRHPKDVKAPENVVRNNLQLVNNSRYKPFYGANWISKLNGLIPLLEEDFEKEREGTWLHEELKSTIANYKKLQTVPRIRRMSIAQQNKNGSATRVQAAARGWLTRRQPQEGKGRPKRLRGKTLRKGKTRRRSY
jgi:hypothetical protein